MVEDKRVMAEKNVPRPESVKITLSKEERKILDERHVELYCRMGKRQ